MTKKIKITIPAGTVSADLPFYCYFVDFSKFPSSFWTDSYNNGGDVRAYDAAGVELPLALMSRYSTVTKTGGCYVRLPVASAVDTVFYIHYNTYGLVKRAFTHAMSFAGVFSGFHFFCDGYDYAAGSLGTALPRNMAGSTETTAMDDGAGVFGDGDGPTGSFTFAGNGYIARDIASDGSYSVGAIAMRAATVTGDVVICEFGNELVFKSDLTCAAEGAVNLVGNAYIPGNLMSVGVVHDGDTSRKLFVNAVEAADDPGTIAGARFSIGAGNAGARPLKGAVRHAFVYNGLLSQQYYEMETFLMATAGEDENLPPEDDGDVTEDYEVILFAGTSLSDFDKNTTDGSTSTTGSNLGPGTNEGVQVNASTELTINLADHHLDLWISGYWAPTSASTQNNQFIKLFDTDYSTTNPLLQYDADAGTYTWEIWNGSAFVDASNAYAGSITARARLDFHVKIDDTGGILETYVNGVLQNTQTITDTKLVTTTGINRVVIRTPGISSANGTTISAIIVSEADTRQLTFYKLPITGAGSTSGWTGAYTDINENGENDTTFIQAGAAELVSTFAVTDLAAGGPSASTLEAVVISARGQAGALAPTKIEGAARISGTDYIQAPEQPAGGSYKPLQAIYHLNPATGQPWIGSEFNAAEFGVKSIA